MGKMKELDEILVHLIEIGNELIHTADSLRQYFSADAVTSEATQETAPPEMKDPPAEPEPAPVDDKKPALSKEDVRKVLVKKSGLEGGLYKPQVKALVRKYSTAGSLSTVPPESYEALLAELEAVGNG